eukprot:gene6602-2645_t
MITLPANGSDLFQVCNQIVNAKIKSSLKASFRTYFSDMFELHMTIGGKPADFSLKWTIKAVQSITEQDIAKSWRRA